MAFIQLTDYDDTWKSWETAALEMRPGETGHAIYGMNGHDNIEGHNTIDHLVGGYGDDFLKGFGNDDTLVGESGNDIMDGGSGNDLIVGDQGYDVLYGGTGQDRMYGGSENDTYYYMMQDGGFDFVNDNKTATGALGAGGGDGDKLIIGDIRTSEMYFYKMQDALVVTSIFDVNDNGMINQGVIIEDFFDKYNMDQSEIEVFEGWNGNDHSISSQQIYDAFMV